MSFINSFAIKSSCSYKTDLVIPVVKNNKTEFILNKLYLDELYRKNKITDNITKDIKLYIKNKNNVIPLYDSNKLKSIINKFFNCNIIIYNNYPIFKVKTIFDFNGILIKYNYFNKDAIILQLNTLFNEFNLNNKIYYYSDEKFNKNLIVNYKVVIFNNINILNNDIKSFLYINKILFIILDDDISNNVNIKFKYLMNGYIKNYICDDIIYSNLIFKFINNNFNDNNNVININISFTEKIINKYNNDFLKSYINNLNFDKFCNKDNNIIKDNNDHQEYIDNECNICFNENIENILLLECKHIICYNCFNSLKNKICPYCRKIINKSNIQFKEIDNIICKYIDKNKSYINSTKLKKLDLDLLNELLFFKNKLIYNLKFSSI
jgi:hypothetical protein